MEIEELHLKLQYHLNEQTKKWKYFIYAKEKGFYQGFEEINIDGWRPTEKRFKQYDIEKYLSTDSDVLDIGCNCGFFSLYSARFVKQIDGVEINPYLIAIAKDVKQYLEQSNANFFASSFENYQAKKTYDVIYSFANDSTIDKNTKFNFEEYIEKIYNFLKINGYLIFESQAADNMPPEKFKPKFEHLKRKFKIIEERIVHSEYPVNVPNRIFLILQKTNYDESKESY